MAIEKEELMNTFEGVDVHGFWEPVPQFHWPTYICWVYEIRF